MENKKVLIAGLGITSALVARELKEKGYDIVVVENDEMEKAKPIQPPELPVVFCPPTAKPKKDKSGVKRYSSYFNKKKG